MKPAVVAELVRASYLIGVLYHTQGRGFEPGYLLFFFERRVSRTRTRMRNELIRSSELIRSQRMRMRSSRKRLLRMRATSIFGYRARIRLPRRVFSRMSIRTSYCACATNVRIRMSRTS